MEKIIYLLIILFNTVSMDQFKVNSELWFVTIDMGSKLLIEICEW